MNFDDKVEYIDKCFEKIAKDDLIVVWGAGIHTEKLFKYTSLIRYKNLIIVDKREGGKAFFGKTVLFPQEIEWSKIKWVVVSTLLYQNEIMKELDGIEEFVGRRICFYKENEVEFWNLNRSDDISKWIEYNTWSEAQINSKGYEDDKILQKVLKATKIIVDADKGFERDGVIFRYDDYSYQLMTLIAFCAMYKEKITIADFGGSGGSLFWKNRKLLAEINKDVEWNVIEQKHFVDCFRKEICKDTKIKFLYSFSDLENSPEIIIFSGVLQYLYEYKKVIKEALELNPKYIFVDRIWFAMRERVCVQHVPEAIYKSSYPMRFFRKDNFIELFSEKYYCFIDGVIPEIGGIFYADGEKCMSGYMVFKRK